MPKTTDEQLKELQAQIAELQSQLGVEKEARSQAEAMAAAAAMASPILVNVAEEQPTGKTITIERCANPWERDEKKQKWVEVEIPTYFYNVQLPPAAGISLSTNGVDYVHGQTYEVDYETLVDLKSRVARCWDHEKSIHGGDENAYRKPKHLRAG